MKRSKSPTKVIMSLSLAAFVMLVVVEPAAAYVGPGAGITMLGALWAVIAAVVLAVVGVVIWPLRAMMRKKRAAKGEAESQGAARESAESGASGK